MPLTTESPTLPLLGLAATRDHGRHSGNTVKRLFSCQVGLLAIPELSQQTEQFTELTS